MTGRESGHRKSHHSSHSNEMRQSVAVGRFTEMLY